MRVDGLLGERESRIGAFEGQKYYRSTIAFYPRKVLPEHFVAASSRLSSAAAGDNDRPRDLDTGLSYLIAARGALPQTPHGARADKLVSATYYSEAIHNDGIQGPLGLCVHSIINLLPYYET